MRQHDPKILYRTNVNVLFTSVCKNTRLYIFNKDAGCSVSDYKKKLLILFISTQPGCIKNRELYIILKQRATHFVVHFLQFHALSQGIRITLYWVVIVFKTNLDCPMLMRNKSVQKMAGGFCW